MQKAAEFVSMPMCHVLPVKNYAVELDTDCNNDILILSAVHSVLQAIDDTLDDQCVSSTVEWPVCHEEDEDDEDVSFQTSS